MLLIEDLTYEQKQIIKQICYAQLNSLRRIYNNQHHSDQDIVMVLIENNIDEEAFKDLIEDKLDKFKDLHKNPENLGKLNDTDLSAIRHILAQIEDEYNETYPQAISNLWQKLFWIEKIRNTSEMLN